jgi:dipeptidyl aminopeptidase/acylaminoacyl peptidase
MRFRSLLVLAALASSLAPARAFDFGDARRIVSLAEPQISPDGTRVLYVRGVPNFETDKTDRQLYVVDLRTHKARALTYDRKGLFGPQWSADGTAIAFAALDSEKDPQEQIFVLPMDGGEARQVTHAKNGVTSWWWSPDASRFAYTMQEDDPNQKLIDQHLDAFQVQDNDYLHTSATPPVHVWVVNADGSHARRLTKGEWSVADVDPDGGGSLSWSPDGKTLAIEHFPTPFVGNSLSAYIALVDVSSGALVRLTPGEEMQSQPQFAPRGDRIAYQRNTGGDYTQGADLYVTDSKGRREGDLRTTLDRNVNEAVWASNGQALWVATPDGTERALWYWTVGGRAVRVATGDVQAGSLGNTAKNGTLVFIGATPSHPGEIYTIAAPSGKPVAITNENAAAEKSGTARSVGVTWRATKGNFVEDGVLTYPLSFDKLRVTKYPLILLIHGGPQGASGTAWSSQRQIFAAHGFFVFEPNYRGSTNLGDAYEHAITNDAGDGPGKDVMAGLAQIEKQFPIDTTRIGVSGWSYGGYMTSWLIGNYPKVWKAAVSGASLDDWLDDYNIAFYYDTDVPFFRGKPWNPKNTAEWRDQSPIAYAPNAVTPTLIMGDIGDNNVTITNSFKLYHALKDNGTTVQFFAYPVPGHFPSDPVRSEDVTKHWLAWLEQYLK